MRRIRRKEQKSLVHRYLKQDAFPTLFPECPSYLSKKKPTGRPPMASSSKRQRVVAERLENEQLNQLELDTVRSLDDIQRLINNEYKSHALTYGR